MRNHKGMTLPAPDCRLGYTATQTAAIVGEHLAEYRTWAYGKTQGVCSGPADDYRPCAVPHGIVEYVDDVGRFLRRH